MRGILRTLVVGLVAGVVLGVTTAAVVSWSTPRQVGPHRTMAGFGAYLAGLFAFCAGCLIGLIARGQP